MTEKQKKEESKNISLNNDKIKNTKKEEIIFSKEQLINAGIFENQKDILNTVLSDNKTYSIKETEQLINKFMKKKVE